MGRWDGFNNYLDRIGYLPTIYAAGMAFGVIQLPFTWQVWYGRYWAGSGDAICPAGIALGNIQILFVWQVRYWKCWLGLVMPLDWIGRAGRHGILRGKHGTRRHPPAICVTGIALGNIHLRFAW